jgi:dynein heavy chain, axonemal
VHDRFLSEHRWRNLVFLPPPIPTALQANLIRSWNNFNEEILDGCAKQGEFRAIVFGLCYFHACLLERKKFGVGNMPGATSGIGWNMNYPFNTGDLLCCGQTAHNYLENNVKVCQQSRAIDSGGMPGLFAVQVVLVSL